MFSVIFVHSNSLDKTFALREAKFNDILTAWCFARSTGNDVVYPDGRKINLAETDVDWLINNGRSDYENETKSENAWGAYDDYRMGRPFQENV